MVCKLLVADDERLIRWSLEQALSKAGHDVTAVTTGNPSSLPFARTRPTLLLLDLTLPDIDRWSPGLATGARARSAPPDPHPADPHHVGEEAQAAHAHGQADVLMQLHH